MARDVTVHLRSAPLGNVDVMDGWVEEAISEPTRASVRILRDGDFDPEVAIGKPAHLEIAIDSGGDVLRRHFHLVITGVTYDGVRSTKHAYTIDLAHELALLELRADVRMFQKKDAKEIVAAVLDAAQIPSDHVAWKLSRAPVKRVYCVQYRESDFAFVSRLLEHEGIFYVTTDSEAATLVTFADSKDAFVGIAGDSAIPLIDEDMHGTGIHELELEHVSTPDASALKDWNYETPGVSLKSSCKAADAKVGEAFEFPGGYQTLPEGDLLAKIRCEELTASKVVGHGRSDRLALRAGAWFELTETSRAALAQRYLLRRVRHELAPLHFERERVAAGYANSFVCSPEAQPYRPPRVTPRAHVQGSHSVVVSGPAGEEIHTDKLGRMKAKFHWDRVGKEDADASCWIRVTQLPIGSSLTLARTGWEMVVRYVHGDPDRPVAVARADNGGHTSPYAYPGAKTSMAMKTLSSPGGAKNNELKMEDSGGGMVWSMNAAKDFVESTNNNKTEKIAVNDKLQVGVDVDTLIGSNQKVTIGANQTTTISADAGVNVKGNRTKTVSAAETCTVSGNEAEKITGSDTETVGGSMMTMAALGVSRTSQGSQSVTVGGSMMSLAGMGCSVSVAGAKSETVGGAKIVAAGGTITESCIGALAVTVGGVIVHAASANRSGSTTGSSAITVGGVAMINAGEKFSVKSKKIKIVVGGVANLVGGGGTITLTPASASMIPVVAINGKNGLKITGNPNLTG